MHVVNNIAFSTGMGNEGSSDGTPKPLSKRLRICGDWSDTGPNARPMSQSHG